jgi:hypothetical protein
MLAVNSAHGRRSAFEAVKGLDPRRLRYRRQLSWRCINIYSGAGPRLGF